MKIFHTLFFSAIISFALILASTDRVGAQTADAVEQLQTLRSSGIDRTFILHIPEGLRYGAPLVIVLHGYGGAAIPARYGMNAVADKHGFAVCYPNGTKDGRGKQCWNVGYPFQSDMTVDDVKFLAHLVRHLQREYHLSRKNVFCTGMSNGGEMCYQLAAQGQDVFRAVAPISGLMMEWLYKADRSTEPMPLLEIHGTADRTSAWEGDLTNKGGWGAYMAVPLAIHYWIAKNRCTTIQTDTIPSLSPSNGHEIIRHKYSGGTDGAQVWLYEIVNGKHSWGDKDINTGEEVWQFFSNFIAD